MRKYSIALSAVGALLMLGATTAAQASVHIRPEATPACSTNCFNLSNLAFGPNYIQSANVPGDYGAGGKTGDTIGLSYATDSSPNEDFTGGYVGSVAQLCSEDQLSPYICNTYGRYSPYHGLWPVYESNWSPYGNETDFCAGVAKAATEGEDVTLQPCGVSGATFWVADQANAHIGYTPWLNGADNTFTHPLVLTAVPYGNGQILRLERLNLLTGGFVQNEQMWTMTFGVEL